MRGGLLGLAVTCTASAGIIAYVHFDQKRDLRRMQQSVLHDAEREAYRRRVHADRDAQAAASASAPGTEAHSPKASSTESTATP
jgi:hypothetical protein